MNRDLCREIMGCLRVAGSVEGHLRSLRNFPARAWEASLDWLNLSGIALAFWDRLQRSGTEDTVPHPIRSVLAQYLADHRLRIAVMMREFDSLNGRFQRAGIEYVVWKGFALIPQYCPDACLRPCYDYDYLISADTWEDAKTVMQAAGYVLKPEPSRRLHVTFVPRDVPAGPSKVPLGLYSASLPRKVELHLSPWDQEVLRISFAVPERAMDRKVLRAWEGLSFYCLADPDAFVLQALHAFQHILINWCRLGWLWEIAYFLQNRSTDSPFWENLREGLKASGPLKEVVALVTSLAARLFHAELPAPVRDQAPSAIRSPVALWVERYGLRSALDNFSENKFALFLYREFVRDEEVWREIRRSRLLPLHRPNRVAGAATPGPSPFLPGSWRQAWYVAQRLIHHSVRGVGYAWESAHWSRLRAR